jgi:hypothetical protein
MPRGRQPGVIYQQPVVDLDTFRGYLATRRQYSGPAIAVRLLLREVPAAITDAPDLLAWIDGARAAVRGAGLRPAGAVGLCRGAPG